MPQLHLTPWLLYMMMTWLILLLLAPKILKYTNLRNPNLGLTKISSRSWMWQW